MESQKSEAAKREEEVLAFWKENEIFQKSLEQGDEDKTFVFYEGPPTANGKPGVHHIESRSFKDAIPRYKTMQGYRVPRRAGWDTHGLPVELEVEKQLGFSGKPDIEKYGIAAFNKKCRESVFNYINDWKIFSERIGYWVDQSKAYFTFDAPYMESLFSIVKKVDADGRLYKDYKVLPWCSRCGTALSSHELAQGYQEVKDLSITAKFELADEPDTYMLAWTTTPWTLPGNIALAVGEDISYSYVESEGAVYIVASALVAKHFGVDALIRKEVQGYELIGKRYTPLYPFAQALAPDSEKAKFDKAFHIYGADFVTTEDGTGVVHTAVMYGQDDFELGQKVGLPKVHLVGADGLFIPGTGFLEGRFVREEDANGKPTLAVDIVDDLTARGLFFSKENYAHTYPFCWRCKTPLIYYARDSWFIRMTDLRESLLAANATINWEPSHIRDGRMGEWLSNVKDWAISRERYWGTPLPVWESEDKTERLVIGSVEELKERTKKSGNTYFTMRHGEATSNIEAYVTSDAQAQVHLTANGRETTEEAVDALLSSHVDLIFVSPVLRTLETAEIVREKLGLPPEAVVVDERLREIGFGEYEGKTCEQYNELAPKDENSWDIAPKGGESRTDVRKRIGEFIYELEETYTDKRILIVSHGDPLWLLLAVAAGATRQQAKAIAENEYPQNSVLGTLAFVPLPHNEDYELDLHRPYIDDVVLTTVDGIELTRVKEVMDVWFDSGSMPYAQDHYPFENKEWIDGKGFPADYISEAIDQTRGWFYTLLAVGALMGKGTPYKNVICLGHLLDEKGQKMSKSKGNIIEPMQAIEKYGADTLRFWMYGVNQPGDSKSFDDKTVKESARVMSWFENSVKFYQLFSDGDTGGEEQVIDVWMRTRLSQTIAKTTQALDAYDVYTASRAIASLIEDLSQWYVRRVRDRVRDGDRAALTTLSDVIEAIAVLLAPLTPFIAEWAYQIVRDEDDAQSVHLAQWFEPGTIDDELIAAMARTRELASQALMMRQRAGIKVSQPLASLTVPEELPKELSELLREEVNVERILVGADQLLLDVELTPELIIKGDERLYVRAVAAARKEKGFAQSDSVKVEEVETGEHVAELSTGTKRFNLVREKHDET